MDTIKTIIVLWLVFDAGFLAGLFWAGRTRRIRREPRLHRKVKSVEQNDTYPPGSKCQGKCHEKRAL